VINVLILAGRDGNPVQEEKEKFERSPERHRALLKARSTAVLFGGAAQAPDEPRRQNCGFDCRAQRPISVYQI